MIIKDLPARLSEYSDFFVSEISIRILSLLMPYTLTIYNLTKIETNH